MPFLVARTNILPTQQKRGWVSAYKQRNIRMINIDSISIMNVFHQTIPKVSYFCARCKTRSPNFTVSIIKEKHLYAFCSTPPPSISHLSPTWSGNVANAHSSGKKIHEKSRKSVSFGSRIGNKKNIGGYGLGIPFGKLLTKHCETPVDTKSS